MKKVSAQNKAHQVKKVRKGEAKPAKKPAKKGSAK